MTLPIEYRWLKAHDFKLMTPWYLLEISAGVSGIRKEYRLESGKDLLPFARRQDNDDIAGFIMSNGNILPEVLTVHLTWSGKLEREGYPITNKSQSMLLWITEVVFPATQDWISEEELRNMHT